MPIFFNSSKYSWLRVSGLSSVVISVLDVVLNKVSNDLNSSMSKSYGVPPPKYKVFNSSPL